MSSMNGKYGPKYLVRCIEDADKKVQKNETQAKMRQHFCIKFNSALKLTLRRLKLESDPSFTIFAQDVGSLSQEDQFLKRVNELAPEKDCRPIPLVPIIIAVVTIVLIIACAVGVYLWKKHKVNPTRPEKALKLTDTEGVEADGKEAEKVTDPDEVQMTYLESPV